MDSHPSPFLSYSTPNPSTPYSATFFRQLTFEGAAKLCFPIICPPKTISAWTFTHKLPAEAHCTIQPNELIPNVADLRPILQEMENAYTTGACASAVSLVSNGQSTDSLYHFSKVLSLLCCCDASATNFVDSSVRSPEQQQKRHRIRPCTCISSDVHPTSATIQLGRIFGPSHLFTDFWLSCNWVSSVEPIVLSQRGMVAEDILNALAELLYFSLAGNSPSETPSTLVLPTHCLHDANYLLDQSPRSFSTNLTALRARIRSTSVEAIFAFNCASKHYSLYSTTGIAELEHSDSLHLQPDSNVLASGCSLEQPSRPRCR
jgi:hypothetical protein